MPAYSLLSEAWSDPIMKQTKNGNFIVNSNEEYDEENIKQNIPSSYSKLLNTSQNNDNLNNSKNTGNLNIYNSHTDPDSDLLLKNQNKKRRNHKLKQTIIEDFSNTNYRLPIDNEQEDDYEESDNEEEYKRTINELKNHVKSLEKQIKSLKNDTNYHINNSSSQSNQNSLFNNVNTNELIVFGSIGIFTIMLIDSFTKIGMKLNSLKQ